MSEQPTPPAPEAGPPTGDEPRGFWALAAAHPDRIAVIDDAGREITAGALLARVNQISHALAAGGVGRGAVVAAVLPNHPAFLEWYLACMQSGLYFAPVNTHATVEEIAALLADSDATVVVAHATTAGAALAAAEQVGIAPRWRIGVDVPADAACVPAEQLLAGQPTAPPAERSLGAIQLATSGTSGRPKAIRRRLSTKPPEHLGRTGRAFGRAFGIPLDRGSNLSVCPLYHAGPLVYLEATLHLGYTQVLMARFEPAELLARIARHGVTSVYLVPTMFHRLLRLPDEERAAADLSSLQMVAHAAAPCPVPVKQAMLDWWGPVIWESYGGSEGPASIASPQEWLARPGTVGRPVAGVTVRIVDDDGAPVPAGTPGSIYVDSGRRRFTYHNDPSQTDEVFRGTAFTLGDVGYLDDDGYLFLCDRKKDMIISGGVNIFPAEVEQVLMGHPEVEDVVVVGVPDEEWGEAVKAVVAPRSWPVDEVRLAAELQDLCRRHIARLKCPRTVDFRPSLPRTETGKLARRHIRDAYWAGAGRQV